MSKNSKQLSVKEEKKIIDGINKDYDRLQSIGKDYIHTYISLGEKLSKAKEKVPHGGWEKWVNLKFNLRFGSAQATKYMKVAAQKELVLAIVNRSDEPIYLDNLTSRITKATEEEKAEAERLKQELVEQEEAKRRAEEEKKKQKEIERASKIAEEARKLEVTTKPAENPEIESVETDDETSRLKKEIEELKEAYQEQTSEFEEALSDNVSMAKVFDSNDQLKAALDEASKLREQNRLLNERMNGLVREKSEAIRQVKYWKNEFLKLEKLIKGQNNAA